MKYFFSSTLLLGLSTLQFSVDANKVDPVIVPVTPEEITQAQRSLHDHPLFDPKGAFASGCFSQEYLKRIAAGQIGYNIQFIMAMTNLRSHLLQYPEVIKDFFDPHLATEFGKDLETDHGLSGDINLVQSGETHIAMIYDFANSLEMNSTEYKDWGNSMETFFDVAMRGLISGKDSLSHALGAFYADEVFAAAWFPDFFEAVQAYATRTNSKLELRFFNSHANEIEPAHVDHANELLDLRKELGLDNEKFQQGYTGFYDAMVGLFDGYLAEMKEYGIPNECATTTMCENSDQTCISPP